MKAYVCCFWWIVQFNLTNSTIYCRRKRTPHREKIRKWYIRNKLFSYYIYFILNDVCSHHQTSLLAHEVVRFNFFTKYNMLLVAWMLRGALSVELWAKKVWVSLIYTGYDEFLWKSYSSILFCSTSSGHLILLRIWHYQRNAVHLYVNYKIIYTLISTC